MSGGKTTTCATDEAIAGRLDALVALLVPVMRSLVKSNAQVESAEERAVFALNAAGIPQLRIARLLGISNNRVNALLKKGATTSRAKRGNSAGTSSENAT